MHAKFGGFTKLLQSKRYIYNFVLGVKQTTLNDFIYGKLGRTDYQSRRFIAIIKYWLKVISSDESKYIKHIYKMMLNDIEARPLKHKWALIVKRLLSNAGFMEVWLSQGVINEHRVLEIFRTRVKDIFMQDWHSRLDEILQYFCKFPLSKLSKNIEQVLVNWDYLHIVLRWKLGDGRSPIKYRMKLEKKIKFVIV